ncbi:MAG: hypothetical protein U0T82_11525 [Bacteroidales bacterium]
MALEAGYAGRMMLELSPRETYGVLSPAFKGNEGFVSLQVFSGNACTFFTNGLCELYGTAFQPLECRFCHHDRKGRGYYCHREIGKDWNNPTAQSLIVKWGNITGFWRKQGYILTPRQG